MKDQDEARLARDEPLSDREELMSMAQKEDLAILQLEVEYRVAGMTPELRTGGGKQDYNCTSVQDLLQYPSSMVDRLGA